MTPSGIEPATFRFVAQHLNHCATAVPFREYENYEYTLLNTTEISKFGQPRNVCGYRNTFLPVKL